MIFNFNNLIYLLFLHLLIIIGLCNRPLRTLRVRLFVGLCKYIFIVPLTVPLTVPLIVGLVVSLVVGLFMGLISLVLFLLYLKFTIYYF